MSKRALPIPLDLVCVKRRVYADEGHFFDLRLNNEQTVEWVTMMKWKSRYCRGMFKRDVQNTDPIQGQLLGDKNFIRLFQVQFPQTYLDGNFPQTRHAQKRLGFFCFNQNPRRLAQARVIVHKPQKGVSVQQNIHGMYSAKSSSGASKSSAISIMPFALPALRG